MNRPYPKLWLLAIVLLLLPQLAHADALSALGYAEMLLFFVALFVAFTLVLMVVASLLPRWRWLYWVQLAFFLFTMVLGLQLARFPSNTDWPLFGRINPFWSLCFPLGAWLNGVVWARQARRQQVKLVWVVVAVYALQYLLVLAPVTWLTGRNDTLARAHVAQTIAGYLVSVFVLGIASWWVVLRQLRHTETGFLWQPWWRAPNASAALSAAYAVVSTFFQLMFPDRYTPGFFDMWPTFLLGMLEGVVVNWLIAVVALRLIPPPAAPPAASYEGHPGY